MCVVSLPLPPFFFFAVISKMGLSIFINYYDYFSNSDAFIPSCNYKTITPQEKRVK